MSDKRCQMAFDIDINLRQEIKILAARRAISVKEWIHRAIVERIQKENKNNKEEHVRIGE